MRGIVYEFPSFRALSIQVEAGGDEQDLELPPGVLATEDGEWVLAEFVIGEARTSIAACIADRGYGLRLAFEDRDWQKLWQFASAGDPLSVPPSSVPPLSGELEPIADTRILVVDDDRETQRVLAALLDAAGYVTSVVSSAEQALDRLRDMTVHLMVLDWALPGMAGVELVKRIRAGGPHARLPVIMLTARSTSADVVFAFEAGVDDFVSKPFRAPELKARIHGLLRRAAMIAAAAPARG